MRWLENYYQITSSLPVYLGGTSFEFWSGDRKFCLVIS